MKNTFEKAAQTMHRALLELYRSAPPGRCEDFHHNKRDLHLFASPCEPLKRYRKALASAGKAVTNFDEELRKLRALRK